MPHGYPVFFTGQKWTYGVMTFGTMVTDGHSMNSSPLT